MDRKPKLAGKARLRFDRHSGGHMLVYPERGLALNESAAAIVKRCDGSRTVEAIIDELAHEAGVPPESIADDVNGVVDELARKGLFES